MKAGKVFRNMRNDPDSHPHELHAVVQRRLSAKQKQEVLVLRQHHGGQLGKQRSHPMKKNSSVCF